MIWSPLAAQKISASSSAQNESNSDTLSVGINFVSDLENGKPTCELEKSIRVAQTLGIDLFAQSRGE